MTKDNPKGLDDADAVIFGFEGSEIFERAFQEGMELVEDAAAYLDGPGRQDCKRLARDAALAYAGESMRLTTRLMQLASWLLVQRAVREGDMTPQEAAQDRYRLEGESREGLDPRDPMVLDLPIGLLDLVRRSDRLFERIHHMDARRGAGPDEDHPVLAQQARLRQAFSS